MRIYLLAISICFICLGCETPQEEPTSGNLFQDQIDKVKKAFAPDKRVALFNIESTGDGQNIVLRGETNLAPAKTQLLADLQAEGIQFIDSIQVLPSAELGEKIYGLVRQSVANIRSKPKHSAELATQALLGTPLKVYKKQGSWYLVQTPDGYISWLDSGGLQLMAKNDFDRWKNSERIIFTAEYGFSRQSARPNAAKVGDLVAGAILNQQELTNGFYQVNYPDGRQAFVDQNQATPLNDWLANVSLEEAYIFQTAAEQIGRPYLWGGTSGKGMDCSGFTKTVFFRHGLIIPRDASQQVFAGQDISIENSLENLLPGDFLFFGNYRDDGSRRISHVGIYLGNGQFIHSGADNGAVAQESLRAEDPNFAEHRLKSLMAARRFLDGDQAQEGIQPIKDSDWYF